MDEIEDENVDVEKVMTYYAANLSDDAVKFWANHKDITQSENISLQQNIDESSNLDPELRSGPPYPETTLQTLKTAFRGT